MVILVVNALLIIGLVRRLVRRPLENTVDMLKDIAEGEGNLTGRLAVRSNDEVGTLAKWFNTFVEKLQSMMRDIGGNAETLTAASSSMSDFSCQMKSSSDVLTAKSSHVTAAADKMNLQMDGMAASMEDVAAKVSAIATTIELKNSRRPQRRSPTILSRRPRGFTISTKTLPRVRPSLERSPRIWPR